MTVYIYMKDSESNYIREFDAVVRGSGEGFVVLDQSAFYPLGGGQPTDKGWLEWSGGRVEVREVRKKGGQHMVSSPIPVGEKVRGILDWERRYAHMRMHTAQHVVSAVQIALSGTGAGVCYPMAETESPERFHECMRSPENSPSAFGLQAVNNVTIRTLSAQLCE